MTGVFSRGDQTDTNEEGGEHRRNRTGENLRFAVYMPASYEDAARSADVMKNGSGVVINGENMDNAVYQRVIDFLDGAAYVLGGAGRRVSDTVQVYVPATVDVVDETVSNYYGNLSAGKKRSDV
jgi:FtsZ-interacting cell division protein YlmF